MAATKFSFVDISTSDRGDFSRIIKIALLFIYLIIILHKSSTVGPFGQDIDEQGYLRPIDVNSGKYGQFEYSTIDVNTGKYGQFHYSTIDVNTGKYGPFEYSTSDVNNVKSLVNIWIFDYWCEHW